MIIIVEGPDGVGKSTQIRHLKSFYSHNRDTLLHELHYTADVAKNMDASQAFRVSKEYYEEMMYVLECMNERGISVVCDRAHLGEYVYSMKYRGYIGDYVFDLEKKELVDAMYENDLFLVVFVADPNDLADREDGNSLGKEVEDKVEETNRFREAFDKSNIKRKIMIDITGKDEYDVWAELIHFLDGDRR